MRKITKTLCGIFIVVFISVDLMGQDLAKLTAEDYGALPSMSLVCISPDGEKIGFRKVDASGNSTISVFSLKAKKTINTTSLGEVKPLSLYFVDNNQLIFIASDHTRVEGFLGSFDVSTAFLIDTEKNKVRQLLIPGEAEIFRGQMGLGNVVGVSLDRNFVYMTAYVGDDRIDPNYTVMKVNVKKFSTPHKISPGHQNAKDFFLDLEGNIVARENYDEKSKKYAVSVPRDNRWEEIFKDTVEVRTKNMVGLTPDYKSLVFFETDSETKHDGYFLMKLENGEITKADFGNSDTDILRTIKDEHRIVQGLVYDGFVQKYKFFDEAVDKRFQAIAEYFPDQNIGLQGWSDDRKTFLLNVSGSNYADSYFLATDGQAPKFITSGRPKITEDLINPIGKVTFTARDGRRIPTLITIPKKQVSNIKNLPAVVMPHGGPESHDDLGFDYRAQALASEGYLVIQPQFRGSSGFGAEHALAGRGEWGNKMQDDVSDAVAFFAKKGYIDPNRVCIAGASYGGYSALAGGAFTPSLYKCVVSINGVANLDSMLDFEKREHSSRSEAVRYWQAQFSNEKIETKKLKAISPEYSAEKFTAPVLLIYSKNDTTVDPGQSTSMKSALKSANKAVQIIALEGDDHYLYNGKTRQEALNATIKFINENIGK